MKGSRGDAPKGDRRGYVERYPCDCTDPGNPNAVCWVVRLPTPKPDVSYTTEYGARMRLKQYRQAQGR